MPSGANAPQQDPCRIPVRPPQKAYVWLSDHLRNEVVLRERKLALAPKRRVPPTPNPIHRLPHVTSTVNPGAIDNSSDRSNPIVLDHGNVDGDTRTGPSAAGSDRTPLPASSPYTQYSYYGEAGGQPTGQASQSRQENSTSRPHQASRKPAEGGGKRRRDADDSPEPRVLETAKKLGKKGKYLECTVPGCAKQFAYMCRLERHLRRHKVFICHMCFNVFTDVDRMAAHRCYHFCRENSCLMRYLDDGNRPTMCSCVYEPLGQRDILYNLQMSLWPGHGKPPLTMTNSAVRATLGGARHGRDGTLELSGYTLVPDGQFNRTLTADDVTETEQSVVDESVSNTVPSITLSYLMSNPPEPVDSETVPDEVPESADKYGDIPNAAGPDIRGDFTTPIDFGDLFEYPNDNAPIDYEGSHELHHALSAAGALSAAVIPHHLVDMRAASESGDYSSTTTPHRAAAASDVQFGYVAGRLYHNTDTTSPPSDVSLQQVQSTSPADDDPLIVPPHIGNYVDNLSYPQRVQFIHYIIGSPNNGDHGRIRDLLGMPPPSVDMSAQEHVVTDRMMMEGSGSNTAVAADVSPQYPSRHLEHNGRRR